MRPFDCILNDRDKIIAALLLEWKLFETKKFLLDRQRNTNKVLQITLFAAIAKCRVFIKHRKTIGVSEKLVLAEPLSAETLKHRSYHVGLKHFKHVPSSINSIVQLESFHQIFISSLTSINYHVDIPEIYKIVLLSASQINLQDIALLVCTVSVLPKGWSHASLYLNNSRQAILVTNKQPLHVWFSRFIHKCKFHATVLSKHVSKLWGSVLSCLASFFTLKLVLRISCAGAITIELLGLF